MAEQSASWLESSNVISMFPTPVWELQFDDGLRDRINAGVLSAVADIRKDEPALAFGQGWQSRQTLHELSRLQELVSCIHDAARGVLRFMKIGCEDLAITGCWVNMLAEGAAHKAHSHPNNFLSGVYYVRVGSGGDAINFHDPRPQTGIIRPPVVELTRENADQVVVKVRPGTLLLFPAYLEHSVDANNSGIERLSVSFNLMFSSFTENLSRPMW